jgi:hypothetical protein
LLLFFHSQSLSLTLHQGSPHQQGEKFQVHLLLLPFFFKKKIVIVFLKNCERNDTLMVLIIMIFYFKFFVLINYLFIFCSLQSFFINSFKGIDLFSWITICTNAYLIWKLNLSYLKYLVEWYILMFILFIYLFIITIWNSYSSMTYLQRNAHYFSYAFKQLN